MVTEERPIIEHDLLKNFQQNMSLSFSSTNGEHSISLLLIALTTFLLDTVKKRKNPARRQTSGGSKLKSALTGTVSEPSSSSWYKDPGPGPNIPFLATSKRPTQRAVKGQKRVFISAVTSPSALLTALSIHWLLLGAVYSQSEAQDAQSSHWTRTVSSLQSLVTNKMVVESATTIIKYATNKVRQAISSQSPHSVAHKLFKRLQDFCQTHLRSPLHFAVGLALSSQHTASRRAPNKLLHAVVGIIAQRVPRWGLLLGNGMTPLATVCHFVLPDQTSSCSSSSSSSSYSSSSSSSALLLHRHQNHYLPSTTSFASSSLSSTSLLIPSTSSSSLSSAWDDRLALLSLARELSRHSSAAVFTADFSGLLPLHAALKQGSLDVARFLYSQFPQAVPLVDDRNRSCLFHALARLAARESSEDRTSTALGQCVLDLMQLYPSAAAEIMDDVKLEQRVLFTELINRLIERRVQVQVQTPKNFSTLSPAPAPAPSPSKPVPSSVLPAVDDDADIPSSSSNTIVDLYVNQNQNQSEPSAKRVRIAVPENESENQATRFSAVGALLLLKGSEDR